MARARRGDSPPRYFGQVNKSNAGLIHGPMTSTLSDLLKVGVRDSCRHWQTEKQTRVLAKHTHVCKIQSRVYHVCKNK